ncbi:MAG: GxxExxY protein [Chitinophagaceae bacterium]|nr:GxxExxY protein [Chitinophagaceae bacterium]
MKYTQECIDKLTYKIIGCAIEVHKNLGPGLLERVYEKCFLKELFIRNIDYRSQVWLPLKYKGLDIESGLRPDIIIEDVIIVEIKAVEVVLPVHEAQLLTYMKLLQKPKGILINFNCTNIFKVGQRTLVNHLYGDLPVR